MPAILPCLLSVLLQVCNGDGKMEQRRVDVAGTHIVGKRQKAIAKIWSCNFSRGSYHECQKPTCKTLELQLHQRWQPANHLQDLF